MTLDGRFLYGAPASDLDLEGEVMIKAAKERPGFAGYQFGVNDDEDEVKSEQTALEDLPQTDDDGKAKFTVTLDKMPTTSRPLEAQITVRLAESGGRAVERKLTLPITPTATMIGVKPLFSGKSLGEGENAGFDVVVAAPDGKQLAAQRAALRTAQGRAALSVVPPRRPLGVRAGQDHARMADGRIDVADRQAGPHLRCR